MKYLVYIKTNGKIYPQLWEIDFSKPLELRLGEIVAKHEIKAYEQSLSFDRLIEKYPYLEKAKDEKILANSGAVIGNFNEH